MISRGDTRRSATWWIWPSASPMSESAGAASATSSASLPLPFITTASLTGEENNDDRRKEENDLPRKGGGERDSSPQSRSETMRASIGSLFPLSCRVELTSPGTRCRRLRRCSPSECISRAEFRDADMFACHDDIGADIVTVIAQLRAKGTGERDSAREKLSRCLGRTAIDFR